MALHNVAQLKLSVGGLLTGTNLDNVTELDTALSRAARYVGQKVDAPEATGREPITLYSNVYYYNAPDKLFGTAVNIIRPQGNVNAGNLQAVKVPMDIFTRGKFYFPNGYMIDLEYDKGVGIIGVSSNVPLPEVVLSSMSDASDWTASGSASTPITDSVNYYQTPASIRTTFTGSSTGILTSVIDAVDLTDYEGVGVVFLAIETPSASLLTSITTRIGSSATDYFSVTSTEGFLGAWQADNWTLVAFDWATATETGTVDIENVDYLQVRVAHTGTLTNFRLGGMWIAQPSLNEIVYQTAAIFKNITTGALSQDIGSDNDIIILSDPAYSILELESAKTIALQMSGGAYTTQIQGFDEILYGKGGDDVGLYGRYSANNPSNQLRQIDSYYEGDRRYGRW